MMTLFAMKPFLLLLVLVLLLSPLPLATAFAPARQERRVARRRPVLVRGATTPVFGILGRFRQRKKVEDQGSPVTVGTVLPDVDVTQIVLADDDDAGPDGSGRIFGIREILGPGKSLLVGMPGAFTPTCSKVHLPGFVRLKRDFAKIGIDRICVVTTNDRFVNQEWMKNAQDIADDDGESNMVVMVSDGDGDLVKSLGMADDMGFGVGIRSKRFVLAVDNGVVTNLFTDDGMEECDATSASTVLKALSPTSGMGDALNMGDQENSAAAAVVGVIGAAALLYAYYTQA